MPRAHAQSPAKSALPGPTDMPIPPEMLSGAAAPKGAPTQALPVPPRGLPMDIKGAGITPVPPVSTEPPPAVLPTPQELDPTLKFLTSQEFVYDPTGRRDPFKPYIYVPKKFNSNIVQRTPERSVIPSLLQSPDQGPTETPESFDITQMTVAAILWDVGDPKAMLEGPTKKLFMVHKHTKVGRNSGYVAAIREGEVVVVEVAPDGKTPTTRVLVLQK